ncbi:chemotaxis protein CheB [Bosea sp. Tri-44]|uniref:chemotaxis protein CheB n=1 Tax=Bosea sp. Tri-44 TaxID=1972137 RepID=UPI0013E93BCD|nr:chemotaxis protein CheB [Bosea sp. Tri-44]
MANTAPIRKKTVSGKSRARGTQRPAATDPQSANPDESDGAAFPIVGIGMSAGGLEVATEFLKAMPPDSGMGFVIVQHLEPTRKSLLAELLGRHTDMPVIEVEDGMAVQANHVYVIVPAQTLLIEDGILRLREPAEPRGRRHPIDHFFTALAKDRKTGSIAVVMSGAGSNGSAGIQDIKLSGGMCIAQTPETAKFDSMPRHAIASGAVDYVLTPDEMPAALMRYAQHPYIEGDATEVIAGASESSFGDVLTLIRARSGHDFRQYKRTTLTRRTHRRMGLAGLDSFDDYLLKLRDDPAELQALVRDMMINVTGFFRDPEAWDALDRDVIGPLVQRAAPDQAIRAWVPACSTGEEAYTIAMLLAEHAETAEKGLQLKIFATDLADNNLAAARRGVYPGSMVESLSSDRLDRFFEKTGESYRIKREIRETVVFAPQNLLVDPPYSKMDLVSCRNLLIYLDADGQNRVLSLAHFALREGGYLFLGNAESVGQRDHLFSIVSKRWRIYQRSGGSKAVDLPIWPPVQAQERERAKPKLADVTVQALADRFGPASVVIDRHYRIQHFHGTTVDYLTQPPGAPTLDLMAMARDGLALAIRRAVKQVLEDNEAAKSVATRAKTGRVEVTASPLGGRNGDGLILVSFSPARKGPESRPAASRTKKAKPEQERDYDDELREAREELQAIVEEYETANEELKAANEEATSVNEELQATNEELESSKEELQSLNEELNAVNTELEHKVAELDETGDDLRNLLSGNDIATIFLDTHTRIKWYTPAVSRLFDVIDADIGRPIANLAQKFVDGDLVGKAREAIDKLAMSEETIRADNGRSYSLRVQPYRTGDNRIAGAVASFVDVTELERSQSHIAEARDYAQAIVRTVHDPMIVLDGGLRVQSANPAFYQYFQVDAKETEGRRVYELGDGQWDIPALRKLLGDLLPTAGWIADFGVEHDFPQIGRRWMALNAQRILGYGDRPDFILLAFNDMTERKQAELHREMLIAELSHRVKNSLMVVQSLAAQTLSSSGTVEEFGKAFTGRLQALGRAHDIALKGGFRHVALGRIVGQALEPFRINGRIEIAEGPLVDFEPVVSQSLTLMLHELATNALKYGALSTDAGLVSIGWRIETNGGNPRFELTWTESGGPAVSAPGRVGQGTRFIKGSVRHELRGEAILDFRPEGLLATIAFPLKDAVNATSAIAPGEES